LTPWTVRKTYKQENSTATARAQKSCTVQASKTKLASKHLVDVIQMDKKGKHALLCKTAYTSHSPARTRVILQAENSAELTKVTLALKKKGQPDCHKTIEKSHDCIKRNKITVELKRCGKERKDIQRT